MNKYFKRILSVFLVVLMAVTSVPVGELLNLNAGLLKNTFGLTAEAKQAQTTGIISSKCGSGADPWYGETMGLNNACADNLKWTLDLDTGEMIIYGSGAMSNMWVFGSLTPWGEYQNYIKKILISDGVTYIGSGAFWNCPNVESFYIPSSVQAVGGYAFMGKDINFGWNYKYSGSTIFYGGNKEQYKAAGLPTGRKDLRVKYNCEQANYALEAINYKNTIQVMAYTTDGNLVPVNGATVFVELGKNILAKFKTNSEGQCDINLSDRVTAAKNIEYLTVRAELETNDYILYSENTDDVKTKLVDTYNQETTFILDKYCKKFNISVACLGKNEEKVKEYIEQFRKSFWEMTNGMCVLGEVTINEYSDEKRFGDENIHFKSKSYVGSNILGYYNPVNNGHITAGLETDDQGSMSGAMLAHEAGHYFFGIMDEYRCGGKIEGESQAVFKPKGVKFDFGIMTCDYDNVRLSTPANYAYLKDIDGIDYSDVTQHRDRPDIYTAQYWNWGCSAQETLDKCMNKYMLTCPYKVEAHSSQAPFSTELYPDFEFIIDDEGDRVLTFPDNDSEGSADGSDVYSTAQETEQKLSAVSGSFGNNKINLSMVGVNEDAHLFIESKDNLYTIREKNIEVSDDCANVQLDYTPGNEYILTLAKKDTDETYLKNTYTISSFKSETSDGTWYSDYADLFADIKGTDNIADDLLILKDDNVYVNGEYESIDGAVSLIKTNEDAELSGEMIKVVSIDSYDLSTIGVFKYENGEYTRISQGYTDGEKVCAYVNFPYDGEGTYVVMAKPASTDAITSVTNLSAVESAETSGVYQINFEDSYDAEDLAVYNVYYSKKPITDIDAEDVYLKSVRPDSESYSVSFYDDYGIWYVAVETVAKNGAKSPLSESVQVNYKPLDSDNDGIPDYWIARYPQLSGVTDVANVDSDNDGLTNINEYKKNTNPLNPDTDGDNVYDGAEIDKKLNPLNPMTDGMTDDYIVAYGQPDLTIQRVSRVGDNLVFEVKNQSDGKAMRAQVSLSTDDEVLACWTEDIGRNTVRFEYPVVNIDNLQTLKITVDERKITRDLDYSNNIFEYSPATSIAFSSESYYVAKGSSVVPEIITEPGNANEVYSWSVSGSNICTVNEMTGEVSVSTIGIATLTVTTLGGVTAQCNIYGVGFEGAEYSEFDSNLIKDGTEVEIVNYIGNDAEITVPSTIGGLPVTSIKSIGSGSVTSVTIPQTVQSVSTSAFNNLASLKSITVDENNEQYSSDSGVLYSKDKTSVIRCPIANENEKIMLPDSVLTISDYAFYKCHISEIDLNSVTKIGSYAFRYCSGIKEITIPESVVSIGLFAFRNCDNLTKLDYNSKNCSFVTILGGIGNPFDKIIEDVTIGDEVQVIPNYFLKYAAITSIDIPDSVKSIGSRAFYGCSSLNTIENAGELTSIGAYAFCNCSALESIELPQGLDSISDGAFKSCTGLTSMYIPENVEFVGSSAFSGCTALESVEFAGETTSIGKGAFEGCSALTSIELPQGLDSISDGAFKNCTSLTSMYIPENVESVGSSAFYGCTALESVDFAGETTSIGKSAFEGCSALTSIQLPQGLDSISDGAFKNCTGLTSIYIPENVESVGSSAFYGCTALESVDFAGETTSIGESAFEGCSALTSIQLPQELDSISDSTFKNCIGLKSVYIPENVETIGSSAFSGCTGLETISIDTYNDASATWIEAENTNVLNGNPKWRKNSSASGGYCVDLGKDLYFDFYVSVPGKFKLYEIAEYNNRAFQLYVDDELYGTYAGEMTIIDGVSNDQILDTYLVTELELTQGHHKIGFKDAGVNPPIYDYFKIEFVDGSEGTITAGDNTGIMLYDGLNTVSSQAFANCTALKDVYFSGSEKRWSAIDINADNTSLLNAAIHFNHVHEFNDVETVKQPGCTTNGIKTVHCSICGCTVKKSIEALGHTEELRNAVSATCASDGYSGDIYCSVCGELISEGEVIAAKEHSLTDWIVDKAATCTEDGSKHRECLNCEYRTDAVIPATGHTEAISAAEQATCSKTGLTQGKYCSVCGEVLIEQKVIPALDHTYGEYVLTTKPTCTKAGVETRTCSVCGDKQTRTVAALGHNEVIDKAVSATCTKTGLTEGKHCSVCGEVLKAQKIVPVIAHNDSDGDGMCDTCGKSMEEVENCSCSCHKGGFAGFIYKIILFFCKLFKINKTCACGVNHY